MQVPDQLPLCPLQVGEESVVDGTDIIDGPSVHKVLKVLDKTNGRESTAIYLPIYPSLHSGQARTNARQFAFARQLRCFTPHATLNFKRQ